jgi:hypothetical protein
MAENLLQLASLSLVKEVRNTLPPYIHLNDNCL